MVLGVFGFSAFNGATLTATYRFDTAGFNITIVFDASTSGWTTPQRTAVSEAIRRWEPMIDGDVDGVWFDGGCGIIGDEYVDDVLVIVRQTVIDGSSGVLAQAGFCNLRATSSSQSGGRVDTNYGQPLPISGVMTFDASDFVDLFGNGLLTDVTTHEVGHILGIGTLWDNPAFDLIQGPASAPFHVGSATVFRFNEAGGSGSEVPVQPQIFGHWDENAFNAELMTPFINLTNPLSAITLGALDDMGYGVEYLLADPYAVPGASISSSAPGSSGVRLLDDIVRYAPPAGSGSRESGAGNR